MVKIWECPACHNAGLKIEVKNGYKVVTSGKPLSEFPCMTLCKVCKRKIKYDVIKEEVSKI